jgi:hypothetical protein
MTSENMEGKSRGIFYTILLMGRCKILNRILESIFSNVSAHNFVPKEAYLNYATFSKDLLSLTNWFVLHRGDGVWTRVYLFL